MLKGIKNPQHEDQVAKEVSTKKQCDKSADYIDSSPFDVSSFLTTMYSRNQVG
jgi:hypothetical protein